MDDQTRLEQADKLRYEGEYAAATTIYDELLGTNPANHLARYGRALCWCFGEGMFDECIAELEQVKSVHPDFLKGRIDLLKTYLMLGMYDEAKAEGRSILDTDPNNEEVLKQMAYFPDF